MTADHITGNRNSQQSHEMGFRGKMQFMHSVFHSNAANNLQKVAKKDFVTMYVDNQLFGLPVEHVEDILGPQKITRIPLSPVYVAGALNLRGRIVTVIDIRTRLGLTGSADSTAQKISIVLEFKGELFSLIVDAVGDVVSLLSEQFEQTPPTLDKNWSDVSKGVYRMDHQIMVVLNVGQLFDFARVDKD